MRAILAAALLFAVVVPRGAHAEEATPAPRPSTSPGRVRLTLLGGFAQGAASFTETRTFTEFAEQGRIESRYEHDSGPGVEAGLAWRFARRLGVSAALSVARRKEGGSFSAALPHPLFFGTPRQAAGDFAGRSQRETAVHLDLAVLGETGRLQWTAFAGPSLIGIRTDFVRSVEYTHVYPYDTVTVTGTPFASVSGHALGFNLGGALAWPAARHVAIETQVRYSRAQVGLEPAPDDRVNVNAGGLSLTGGLRLDF